MLFFKKTLVMILCIVVNQNRMPYFLSNAFSPHQSNSIRMRRLSSLQFVHFHSRPGHGHFGSFPSQRYIETASNGATATRRRGRGEMSFSWPFQIRYSGGVSGNPTLSTATGASSRGRLLMKKEEDSTIPLLRSRRVYDQETTTTNNISANNGSTSPSSKKDYSLSAASLFSESVGTTSYANTENMLEEFERIMSKVLPNGKKIMPVISAALLITSTTVGASMMVLPGLAQGPGMIVSSSLIAGAWGCLTGCLFVCFVCIFHFVGDISSNPLHLHYCIFNF